MAYAPIVAVCYNVAKCFQGNMDCDQLWLTFMFLFDLIYDLVLLLEIWVFYAWLFYVRLQSL